MIGFIFFMLFSFMFLKTLSDIKGEMENDKNLHIVSCNRKEEITVINNNQHYTYIEDDEDDNEDDDWEEEEDDEDEEYYNINYYDECEYYNYSMLCNDDDLYCNETGCYCMK